MREERGAQDDNGKSYVALMQEAPLKRGAHGVLEGRKTFDN